MFFLNLFHLFVCLLQLSVDIGCCASKVLSKSTFSAIPTRQDVQPVQPLCSPVVFEPLSPCEAQATARPGSVCPTGFLCAFRLGEQRFQWAKNRCKFMHIVCQAVS